MTTFVDKLKLAERAEEDIYFARIDRKLIAALHRREQSEPPAAVGDDRHHTQKDDDVERNGLIKPGQKAAE